MADDTKGSGGPGAPAPPGGGGEPPKPPAAAGPKPPAAAGPKRPPKPAGPDLDAEVVSVPLEKLRATFADEIEEVVHHCGEVSVRVKPGRHVDILRFLRDDDACRMDLLMDLCCADYPDREKRFELNYHLYSIPRAHFLRLKLDAAETDEVPTVTGLWGTANWPEREIFDLFGLKFADHPDLRRILMPDDWRGHPLRKEYPLAGFPDQHFKLR